MTRRASCAGKCQVIREVCSSVSAFRLTLSLVDSQLLNNNTCHFQNCLKIFQEYKMSSGWYIRHTEYLQQLFADRFVDFDKVRGLFRTIADFLKYDMKMMKLLYILN